MTGPFEGGLVRSRQTETRREEMLELGRDSRHGGGNFENSEEVNLEPGGDFGNSEEKDS